MHAFLSENVKQRRKCKTKGKKYTAGYLKAEDYLNKLMHIDEGFRV